MKTDRKTAFIIGAGPAGLTAAYELIQKTDILPIIFEQTGDIGGISKTVNYKGNRIDIGGHRFFSKSDRVMKWWQQIMPLQGAPARDDLLLGRTVALQEVGGPDPEQTDMVMLKRQRLSRIFYLRKFFNYPISLSLETLSNLGMLKVVRIGCSYLRSRLCPISKEKSLEDFFINRFGSELYLTFFRDYTEKVWGVPCNQIKPEWGAQRIKGLSISTAVLHALKKLFSSTTSIAQKEVETSLIEQFLYPKLGPGQMWEEVARIIVEQGGEIHLNCQVTGLETEGNVVTRVEVRDNATGHTSKRDADYLFSTMAVRDLIASMDPGQVPPEVKKVAEGLVYRDFITVGLLLKRLKIRNKTSVKTVNDIVPDNWIYIQERDVKLGRLQVFNNWSPYLVSSPDTVWVGLEYFCQEGDELWSMQDGDLAQFAVDELAKIDMIDKDAVIDSCVLRVPKAYPAYFGSYGEFDTVRNYTDRISNLYLIGRNGMHRYNNADHSMLTAMVAVENIINKNKDKKNIWDVNAEEEYHESK